MNGYATGVSSQALDLGSIASNYMQSAVEQKLQEIKENKAQISENAKNVLKAMSVKAIPEMSGALRDTMNKKIEDYRNDVISRFRKTEGKLTFDDQSAIEGGFMDLQNEMNMQKNMLDKGAALQKILLDPKAKEVYDVNKAWTAFSNWKKDFEAGKSVSDPITILATSVKPTDYRAEAMKDWEKISSNIGINKEATVAGGVETTKSGLDLEKAGGALDMMLSTDKYQYASPEQKQAIKQEMLANFTKQGIAKEPVKQKATKASGIGGLAKDAYDYTPKQVSIFGKSYTGIDIPTNVAQSPRSYVIPNAVNLTTGESNVSVPKDAELKFIDVDNNKLLFEGKGGEAQRSGQTLFFPENMSPVKEKGQWQGGKTESDLQKDATKKSALESAFARQYPDSKTPSEYKDITLTKSDGSVTVSGTAIVKGKEMPVSTTYKTVKDESQSATYEAPLYENQSAVAVVMPKVAIRGVPLSEYFKRYERGEMKQAAQVPSYSKAFLLGQGYSESQINKAVQSGKLKLK